VREISSTTLMKHCKDWHVRKQTSTWLIVKNKQTVEVTIKDAPKTEL